MKIAIMQPYFLPYIGYFQLINSVDRFVIYDNIQFTKRGWIHRNRILSNDQDRMISLPLKKASSYLDICDRELSGDFKFKRHKFLNRIENAYRNATHFKRIFPVIRSIYLDEATNLFKFVYNSIVTVNKHIGITTPIVISSSVPVNRSIKGQEKVVSICKSLNATLYINPIGGLNLYDEESFLEIGVKLRFIKKRNIQYEQFNKPFIPDLSIIDVLMFNSRRSINQLLKNYDIL